MLWPLFARAPRHWFLENFLLSAPGVQSVFFCCAPLGAATFRRGQSKKNTTQGVFFCCGPGERQGKEKPRWKPARGQSKKKHTTQGVFFFLLRPCADAHSLTGGLGGDASPSLGRCFFFCCGPARTGVVFFFCCGPARTLTHSRWAGAISARPGWCFFFLLRPRRVFLDNSKKCLGYYIGSKKTRRGHSKKKNTTSAP